MLVSDFIKPVVHIVILYVSNNCTRQILANLINHIMCDTLKGSAVLYYGGG